MKVKGQDECKHSNVSQLAQLLLGYGFLTQLGDRYTHCRTVRTGQNEPCYLPVRKFGNKSYIKFITDHTPPSLTALKIDKHDNFHSLLPFNVHEITEKSNRDYFILLLQKRPSQLRLSQQHETISNIVQCLRSSAILLS